MVDAEPAEPTATEYEFLVELAGHAPHALTDTGRLPRVCGREWVSEP